MNAAARLNKEILTPSFTLSMIFNRQQWVNLMLLTTVFFTALSIIYVTNTSRNLNASLQKSQDNYSQLRVQRGKLLLEKSTWATQMRVETIAQQRLNMQFPAKKDMVLVNGEIS